MNHVQNFVKYFMCKNKKGEKTKGKSERGQQYYKNLKNKNGERERSSQMPSFTWLPFTENALLSWLN